MVANVMNPEPARRSRAVLAALVAGLSGLGCARLDMARAYDAKRPATTIAYTGVREETRLYPDYGGLGASILSGDGGDGKPGSKPKKKGP